MISTREYSVRLQEKLIKAFREEFYEKTGRKVSVKYDDEISISKEDLVMKPSLPELLDFINQFIPHHMRSNTILVKNRKKEYVILREIFCYVADSMDYSCTSIAAFLNRDHTTVLHNKQECKNRMVTDETFKPIFNHIVNEFKNAYGIHPTAAKAKADTQPVLSDDLFQG